MVASPFRCSFVRDYGDPYGEAAACRSDCALFDFSFVARAAVVGPRAAEVLGSFGARPLDSLAPGRLCYALHARPDGTLLSDLTIWNRGGSRFEMMTGRAADLDELARLIEPSVFDDLSDRTSIFALQGPNSLRALAGLADCERLARLAYFAHEESEIAGVRCRVGRLGYTGERGFELVLPRAQGERLWRILADRARPAGFAAADMLRIEAGLVLFANEFALPVTAEEAGLTRFGTARTRDVEAPLLRLVCVRGGAAIDPLLWRPPDELARPRRAGMIAVTSACRSLVADAILALGYVLADEAEIGAPVVDPLGHFHDLRIVPLPYYDTEKRLSRGNWMAI